LSNKASILELSASSLEISLSSSLVRLSLSSALSSCCLVRCSMSYTGRQFNIAKQRRHSGKVESHADLLIDGKGAELPEVAIAVVGGE